MMRKNNIGLRTAERGVLLEWCYNDRIMLYSKTFFFLFAAGTSSTNSRRQGVQENFVEIFNSGDIQVSSQGSLVIPNASGHHVGRYLCQGSNGVGQPLQVIVNITVKVPPKINKDKTKVSVAVGEDRINLPCNADGDRPINVKWSKVSKLSPYFIFNLPIFFSQKF